MKKQSLKIRLSPKKKGLDCSLLKEFEFLINEAAALHNEKARTEIGSFDGAVLELIIKAQQAEKIVEAVMCWFEIKKFLKGRPPQKVLHRFNEGDSLELNFKPNGTKRMLRS